MDKISKEEFRLMLELLIATDLENAYHGGAGIPKEEEFISLQNALLTCVYFIHDWTPVGMFLLNPDKDLLDPSRAYGDKIVKALKLWTK